MIENDIIDIQDKFLIDDNHSHIRGFVAGYDENGNRLFLKENMIVIKGREEILKRLRYSGESNTSFFGKLDAFLDTSTAVTSPTMNFPSGDNVSSDSIPFKGLSLMELGNIRKAMGNMHLIESENSENIYSKVFDGSKHYYFFSTVKVERNGETPFITVLEEATNIKAGTYYYTLNELENAPSADDFKKYYYFKESQWTDATNSNHTGNYEMVTEKGDDETIYSVSPASTASYNSSKQYYTKAGNIYTAADLGENGFSANTDYYVRNVKVVNFDLVECFKITYSAFSSNENGQRRFGSLGLYFPGSDPENKFSGATLFSRVTFPPYSARSNLTFYYYLYF